MSDESVMSDVQTVSLEAIDLLERGGEDTARTAVATAIGNTIPNDRGPEHYKADLLVKATRVVNEAIGVEVDQ